MPPGLRGRKWDFHSPARQTRLLRCSISPSPVSRSRSLNERGPHIMNAEATETHSSVRCIFCAQQIPLSSKLANLYVVAKDESHRAEHEHRSGVMLLRCAKC